MNLRTIFLFVLAAFCEIGGGYLVWLWLKANRPLWFALAGGLILAGYGIVAALQNSSFTRVYAAYGGIFIILSIGWGMWVDNFKPDTYDFIGAGLCLASVLFIYVPR